jgi:protein tyrosine/serine phosphatase
MLSVFLGLALVASVIAGPVYFAVHQLRQQRHFKVVQEGVLYRSGQMTVDGLRRVVHDYGIRTIITLRDPLDSSRGERDRQEEEFCKKEDVQFVRLPPRGWMDTSFGPAPVEENVQKFLRTLHDSRSQPVLIHCFAGIHRTGAYCAVYRMEFEHWSNEQAIAELRAAGYLQIDEQEDVLGYLEHYVPAWKKEEATQK